MGCVPRLNDVALRHCVTGLSLEEIQKKIEEFNFYNGKFRVSIVSKNKKKRFQFHAKAVQVSDFVLVFKITTIFSQNMELLSRFEEIFHGHIDRSSRNIGYRLFRALHNYCAIVMSEVITTEDLDKLDQNAEYLMAACKELEDEGRLDELEAVEDEENLSFGDMEQELREVLRLGEDEDIDLEPVNVNSTEQSDPSIQQLEIINNKRKNNKRYAIFSKVCSFLHDFNSNIIFYL